MPLLFCKCPEAEACKSGGWGMGDHFVLQVDRLLTESTTEASIESANPSRLDPSSFVEEGDSGLSLSRMDPYHIPFAIEFGLCRICHDEDDRRDMDAPCSCRGSLKYAHRKCVQRWCDEKGDTMCEICQQPFNPDYTAPLLYHYGVASLNFREIWELPRIEPHDGHQLISMVEGSGDDDYSDSGTEYSAPSPSSLLCCRIIAVTFMVLLVLRYTLPIVTSEAGDYSLTLFSVRVVTIGIIYAIYIMVKDLNAIQHRYQFPEANTTDDERDSNQVQP